jgi:hypothetical protein
MENYYLNEKNIKYNIYQPNEKNDDELELFFDILENTSKIIFNNKLTFIKNNNFKSNNNLLIKNRFY